MSGPIVRKYGFPNFDKIFGKRELEHGVDTPPPGAAGRDARRPDSPSPGRPTSPRSAEGK